MKTIFSVGKGPQPQDVLLVEIGPDYCCSAFYDPAARAFHQVSYVAFSETEDELAPLFDQWPERPAKVVICSAVTESLLVPQKLYRPQPSLTAAIYDLDEQYHELNDRIPEWQMVNAYALPSMLYNELSQRFPEATYFHVYTPALRRAGGSDELGLHFTTTHFRVLVKKEGQVQLAQTYAYKAPLDVVYFLLKISYEFKLDQSSLPVTVSGLVEKDSALYAELRQYFTNVEVAPAQEFTLPESDLPAYYFTSLFNLASCVS